MTQDNSAPIIALATPVGSGAIGVVRISGDGCIPIVDRFFSNRLRDKKGHTVHFGKLTNEKDEIIDECLVTLFRAPRSYTREESVEISCHGSSYIINEIIQLFLRNGIRHANPGEFTMRAFLNGQLDLSQAEAVADLIAADSKAAHDMAIHQLRGGFSVMIQNLRQKLIKFASLIELENDFGEEDVEFADRTELVQLVQTNIDMIEELRISFGLGNALKKGVSVAIIGKPNVGKSTLLNALLNESKAIVSEVPGTTRDVIEDTIQIEGILFRFIDTAGLRDTKDKVESIGIERTHEQISKAQIILFVTEIQEDHKAIVAEYTSLNLDKDQIAIIVLNKSDDFHGCHMYDVEEAVSTMLKRLPVIAISAKENLHIDKLKTTLVSNINEGNINTQGLIISNARHYDMLTRSSESLQSVIQGLQQGVPSDMVAIDIRHALHHLGMISGEISTDDLLDSIFRDFCIGK